MSVGSEHGFLIWTNTAVLALSKLSGTVPTVNYHMVDMVQLKMMCLSETFILSNSHLFVPAVVRLLVVCTSSTFS